MDSRRLPAHLFLSFLALASCMKAERLGTDTNTPDGLALGYFGGSALGAGAASSHSISGTVTGLTGDRLVLSNGTDAVTVTADGSFSFPALPDQTTYTLSVTTQPVNLPQTCSISSPVSGTLSGANVTGVAVTCVAHGLETAAVATGIANPTTAVGIDDAANAMVAWYEQAQVSTYVHATQPNFNGPNAGHTQVTALFNSTGSPYLQLVMNGSGKAAVVVSQATGAFFPLSNGFSGTAWLAGGNLCNSGCGAYPFAAGIDSAGGIMLVGSSGASGLIGLRTTGPANVWGTTMPGLSPPACTGTPALGYTRAKRGALACGGASSSVEVAFVGDAQSGIWTSRSPGLSHGATPSMKVATNDRGDMVIGYYDSANSSPFARNYSATSGSWTAPDTWGTSVGPIGQVSTYDIAMDAMGNVLLAWYNNSTHQVCYERRLVGATTGTGKCATTETYTTSGTGSKVVLAINEQGAGYLGVVVSGITGLGTAVYLVGIDTRGRIDPPGVIVNSFASTTGLPDLSLAVNATGQMAAAWGVYNGSTYNLHAHTIR